MKIRSLQVEQFRKFDQAVRVDGFSDGLNIIEGPNETGKSTLMLALRAVLFERHNAKTDAIRTFSPYQVQGARPTVTLTFDIDGQHHRLEKSFLKRPSATLETSDGRRFEGAEAESEVKRLLGLNPAEKAPINKGSPAHFGVLLTPQAQSFQQPSITANTRHTLEAAITAEVDELGNQSEVDGLLGEFDDMLFDIVSKRGEPKNRYREVISRLEGVEQEIAATTSERNALRDELEALAKAIAERDDLLADDALEDLPGRLARLEASRVHMMQRQALENKHLAASQHYQAAMADRLSRQTRQEERQRLTEEIETIETTTDNARDRLRVIEETISALAGELAERREALEAMRQRKRDLEALGRQFERLRQINATLSALATDVRLEFDDDALDRITLDGDPAVTANDLRKVTEGLAIEIEGVGRIGIEPKIEPMREALEAKATVRNETARLLSALDLSDADPDSIEAAWQAFTSDIADQESNLLELETKDAEARRCAVEVKTALQASVDRLSHVTQRLNDIDAANEPEDEAAKDAEIRDAKAAVDAADRALQAYRERDPQDASALDTEIQEVRMRMDDHRRTIEDAGRNVAALEAAIMVRSGLGLDEKLDHLERERHLLAEERDAFALDQKALSLLQSTLRDAAAEAKATFNAPLSTRLTPYIRDLFPDAAPLVTPEFSIRALDRSGAEEPFLQLSDGTREQVAILARLAFADMLCEQGLPALVVLDDALAFSDERRFQRMVAILEKVAKRMQVVILTCREERFADLEATRLVIEPASSVAPSAA